ncbi:MAG: DNA (cytosine-5-)-methyltransferase [Parvularculaceae bacterium]
MPSYFEFFCGGGMVRAGLGSEWRCLLANDFDPKKADTYALNWGKETLIVGDVRNIGTKDLLARSNGECVDLAWASFPCQDLSLAGGGAGLRGERSGTFWPFWEKMNGLAKTGKHPRIVALENVCGALTSHDGNDFVAITNALIKLDYKVGAIVIDARKFLPQSRPRLFFICIRSNIDIPIQLTEDTPSPAWHPSALVKAQERLQGKAKANWVWWNPPPPPPRRKYLRQVIETGSSETWHSRDESSYLISMMNDVNLNKLKQAQRQKKPIVGTMYRRTRYERGNGKVQRVEVRFDGNSRLS